MSRIFPLYVFDIDLAARTVTGESINKSPRVYRVNQRVVISCEYKDLRNRMCYLGETSGGDVVRERRIRLGKES